MNHRSSLGHCSTALMMGLLAIVFAQDGSSQTPQTPPAAAKALTFDVVSVKPAKSSCELDSIGPDPDGFHLHCIPLSALIRFAYGYGAFNDERVFGEPGWIKSASFDIDAKIDGADAEAFDHLSFRQRASMLQAILASRFKLSVHNESRTLPIYAFVVAKGGSRLKETNPEDAAKKFLPTLRMRGSGKIEAYHCAIEDLLSFLSPLEGRTVVDRTGLRGKYDFTLTWAPDTIKAQASADDESQPSIFTAVQEQLGLKFEPQKGPLTVLVVDRVENPSAN